MPFIVPSNYIDFTNNNSNEKSEFIFDLLNRQRNAAKITLEHGLNLTQQVKWALVFIIVASNTNFGVALASSIENNMYTYTEFFPLYRTILEQQMDEAVIDFFIHE